MKNKNVKSYVIRFRVTLEEKRIIEKRALDKGYNNVSAFLRDLALGVA